MKVYYFTNIVYSITCVFPRICLDFQNSNSVEYLWTVASVFCNEYGSLNEINRLIRELSFIFFFFLFSCGFHALKKLKCFLGNFLSSNFRFLVSKKFCTLIKSLFTPELWSVMNDNYAESTNIDIPADEI